MESSDVKSTRSNFSKAFLFFCLLASDSIVFKCVPSLDLTQANVIGVPRTGFEILRHVLLNPATMSPSDIMTMNGCNMTVLPVEVILYERKEMDYVHCEQTPGEMQNLRWITTSDKCIQQRETEWDDCRDPWCIQGKSLAKSLIWSAFVKGVSTLKQLLGFMIPFVCVLKHSYNN